MYPGDSPWGRRDGKMKTSTIGIVSAAILIAVAGVGLGIAQAGGNPSGNPALTLQEQEALGQSSSSSPYVADLVETGNLPEPTQIAVSPADDSIAENPEDQEIPEAAISSQESVPEGNGSGADWQARKPVETGSLPDQSDVNDLDHSNVPLEGNVHRYWGNDNPSN
jgi:hypothetical protein